MPLFPESETTWFAKVTDVELVFRFDERGVASGVTLHQAGRSRELKKIE